MKDAVMGNTMSSLTGSIEKMFPTQVSAIEWLIGLGLMVLGTIAMTAIENGQGIYFSAEMADGSKYSFSTVHINQ